MKKLCTPKWFKLGAFVLLLTLSLNGQAQERKMKQANEKFGEMAYMEAIDLYSQVAESGYRSEELFSKLGDAYYFNGMYTEAAKWYGELLKENPNTDAVHYLRYSQSLKSIGSADLAATYYDKYAQTAGSGNTKASEYMNRIEENSGRYTIKPLSINTEGEDFGTTLSGNKIVFASSRRSSSKDPWSELGFLDLFETFEIDKDSLSEPKKLEGDVNTKFHESTATFTKDGKTMYFTRTDPKSAAKSDEKSAPRKLKIYRAHLVSGQWTNVEDLSINSNAYSTAHPVLNKEENRLYFVSDMRGSVGATDIYYANLAKDGSLGAPVNLGKNVNTKGRESFPFITEKDELYFSSDGHFGLGGYDVFYIKMKDGQFEDHVINVGRPINSAQDDVSYVIYGNKGFISSNRPGGKGYDDIYGFVQTKEIKDVFKALIHGLITDRSTLQPLSDALIVVKDLNGNEVSRVYSGADGKYTFNPLEDESYTIMAEKSGYDPQTITSNAGQRDRTVNLSLDQFIEKPKAGEDLAFLRNVIIYFDFDKWNIRSDAKTELQKIIDVMKRYPDMKVDVQSYADSRGTDEYNRKLSQKRANATVDYLVSQGISRSRLTATGFGELKGDNYDKNRKSMFIVSY